MIGVSKRRCLYFAKVDRIFRGLGVDESRLEHLGWTKLVVLVDHIDSANCDALLEMAEFCSVRQLRLLLRNEPPVLGERCVVFYLSPAQHAVFEKAMLAHGAVKVGKGLMGKEAALIAALSPTKG